MTNETTPTVDVIQEEDILTWEDLSTVTTKTIFVPKYNKYITYRTFVPLDVISQIQAQYMGANKDFLGYAIAILKYVMVAPTLASPEAVRAAMKGDSGLLLSVISDAVNAKEATEIKNGLPNGLRPTS